MPKINIYINKNTVRIDNTPENLLYVKSNTEYSITSIKKDIRMSRMKKKDIFTTKVDTGWYYTINDDSISIPFGLLKYLPPDTFNIIDNTVNSINIPDDISEDYIRNSLDNYTLRDDQVDSVTKCLINKRGIIQSATASGKSIMILSLVKIITEFNPNAKVLIIEPTILLVNSMTDYLINEGIPRDNFTVSTTLTNYVKNKNNLLNYNILILDEVQHGAAPSWSNLIRGCENAEFVLGFSAKVISDKKVEHISDFNYNEATIIGLVGPILVDRAPKEFIKLGILSTPVLIALQFNHTNLDKKDKNGNNEPELNWSTCIKYGLMNSDRLSQLALIASILESYNRRVLILVITKMQGYDIAEWLLKINPNITVGLTYGGNDGSYLDKNGWRKESSSEVFKEFKSKKFNILIGTSCMDEGADIPSLDACIMAGGGKTPRRIIQRVGRVLRLSKTGKYAYIIDCEDSGSVVLSKQFKRRLSTYVSDIGVDTDKIFRSMYIYDFESKFKTLEGI